MEKILLDTDIGDDIDDAIALAYLLSQPRCDLLGITTVFHRTDERAKLASVLCKAAGKDVPIVPGVGKPLLLKGEYPTPPQCASLPNWPHETVFSDKGAVAFMRETIRKHPGEITLLAIGPMTNVGLLFACDPEIAGLLKRVVLMCGRFGNAIPWLPITEWNALCDPHATAIVYGAPVKMCRSIGLDVTCQVTMGKSEVHKRFTSKMLKPVLDFAGAWFGPDCDTDGGRRPEPRITFHDPLAAVSIFEPDVCGYKRGAVDVELSSRRLMGLTYWRDDPDGNQEAAFTVEPERFFEHYFSVVGGVE